MSRVRYPAIAEDSPAMSLPATRSSAGGGLIRSRTVSFLAIDIGNTRLKWALYAQPVPGEAPVRHGAVFLETIDELAETDWATLPPPDQMLGCVVAGEAVRRTVGYDLFDTQRLAGLVLAQGMIAQMQNMANQRKEKKRDRAQQQNRGYRVRGVFLVGIDGPLGGDDRGDSANGRPDGQERYQFRLEFESPAKIGHKRERERQFNRDKNQRNATQAANIA